MTMISETNIDTILDKLVSSREIIVSINNKGELHRYPDAKLNLAKEFGLDPEKWEIEDYRFVPSDFKIYDYSDKNAISNALSAGTKLLVASRGKSKDKKEQRSSIPLKNIGLHKINTREARWGSHLSDDRYKCYGTVVLNGEERIIRGEFSFFKEAFGAEITEKLEIKCQGYSNLIAGGNAKKIVKEMWNTRHGYFSESNNHSFDFDISSIYHLNNYLSISSSDDESITSIAKGLLDGGVIPKKIDPIGFAKLYNKIEKYCDDLLRSNPYEGICLRSILKESKRSINGVKISSLINDVFADVDSVESLHKEMQPFMAERNSSSLNWLEDTLSNLDFYKDKRRKVLSKQADRAFSKLMEEYESLDLNEKKYPKLTACIKAGEIPVSTFFRKAEQYFLLNDNFELWERMLKLDKDTTIKLAKEVSKRTTYEKDLMSYFYFILEDLPAYMKKHTGEKWTCIPRLIESESELNPPEEDESGIVRTRSALTPVADNDSRSIVVPYASLAIPGRQTTYCYSHSYHVIRKGFTLNGNVCMNDTEAKLNGRDDYGLMFYTLTGSAQGRGYPTFLIIFERHNSGDTTVHFHRTHPCRSKNGDYNTVHNWIRVCYNWMAGNVRAENIKAQQGDLFFVAIDGSDIEFKKKVTDYDNHRFESAVSFADYEKKAKSNILGYAKVEKDMFLNHNEHDDEKILAGTYAVHQCRSWEANPRGIWTLNID